MRAVVQRVSEARVTVAGRETGRIGPGVLVYLGVEKDDRDVDLDYIVEKISGLRIFQDEEGRMNRSVIETGGSVLVVSQFTICGDARKGRRPSWSDAAPPDAARAFYDASIDRFAAMGMTVASGEFQASMEVTSINRGPVTILLDSRKRF